MEDKESEEKGGNNEVPEQLVEEQPDLEEVVKNEIEDKEVVELNVVEEEDQDATGTAPLGQDTLTSTVNEGADSSTISDTVEKVSQCV